MRSAIRRLWNASQPLLQKPRVWTAFVLRQFLFRTTFIAITGSNGKTTATRILAAILSEQAPTQWTRLNRNTWAGATETIAFCVPRKTRFAIFEVAAGRPGQVRKLARLIRPRIAIVLSVFLEHRASLKTLEGVAREKADLIAQLPAGGIAVTNDDDPLVSRMPVPPGRKTIRFGASRDCGVSYENAVSAFPQMLRFTAVVAGQRQEIHTRLLGTHWVGPVLACVAVAHHLGVPLDRIARAIRTVPPYPGRMHVLRLPSGAVVIRDEFKGGAHTIEAAFEELRKAEAKRKLLVFCDQSDTGLSPKKRLKKIGRRAADLVDYAIFIGEQAHHGVLGAQRGGLPEAQTLAFENYLEASAFLKLMLGPGDIVLLKAERHRQLSRLFYSLLGTVRCTIPKCDRKTICDDCFEYRNADLVQFANEKLTVTAD